jgi:hypothetical protein
VSSSLYSFLLYILLNGEDFLNLRVDGRAVRGIHKLLTLGTVEETELYSGRKPLKLQSLLNALYVEHVPAR